MTEQGLTTPPADHEQPLLIASMASIMTHAQLVALLQEQDFGAGSQQSLQQQSSSGNIRSRCQLDADLATLVIEYLTIKRVQHATVVGCSSTQGVHALSACLSNDPSTWWLSQAGSMPGGQGREYVEFRLTSSTTTESTSRTSPSSLCRLSAVSIRIPPLPTGPLSVRDFVLQAPVDIIGKALAGKATTMSIETDSSHSGNAERQLQQQQDDFDDSWQSISPVWQMANRSGLQRFELEAPGQDVHTVRLVCLSNQISHYIGSANDDAENTRRNRELGRDFQMVGFLTVVFE